MASAADGRTDTGAGRSGFLPDRVVHLAAQSSARDSWTDAEGTLRTNLLGLLHLLEALRSLGLAPRVLVVGSSEEYGAPEGDAPVRESAPLTTKPWLSAEARSDAPRATKSWFGSIA